MCKRISLISFSLCFVLILPRCFFFFRFFSIVFIFLLLLRFGRVFVGIFISTIRMRMRESFRFARCNGPADFLVSVERMENCTFSSRQSQSSFVSLIHFTLLGFDHTFSDFSVCHGTFMHVQLNRMRIDDEDDDDEEKERKKMQKKKQQQLFRMRNNTNAESLSRRHANQMSTLRYLSSLLLSHSLLL